MQSRYYLALQCSELWEESLYLHNLCSHFIQWFTSILCPVISFDNSGTKGACVSVMGGGWQWMEQDEIQFPVHTLANNIKSVVQWASKRKMSLLYIQPINRYIKKINIYPIYSQMCHTVCKPWKKILFMSSKVIIYSIYNVKLFWNSEVPIYTSFCPYVPINQRMINRKFRLVYCLTSLPMELLLKIKKQFKVLPDVHRFENEHTTKSVSLSP